MDMFPRIRDAIQQQPHGAINRLLIFALINAVSESAVSVELIQNGSFEQGAPFPGSSIIATEWNDGPGSGNDIGFHARPYPVGGCGDQWCAFPPGFVTPSPPSSGVSGPIGRGGYFAGDFGRVNGAGGVGGSATQHVDLMPYRGQAFECSAWFASAIRDTDYAFLTLQFFSGQDATDDPLGTILFDGNDQQSPFIVGSANPQGIADPVIAATEDNWTFYRATGRIPANAASAAVSLRNGTVSGFTGNNGYVDLVSLQLIPEPPSALMLLVVLPAILLVLSTRRRSA